MKIFLYGHNGSGNHGCEAIVRSTTSILEGNHFTLYTARPNEDTEYGLHLLCSIEDSCKVFLNKLSWRFLLAYGVLKIKRDEGPLLRYQKQCSLWRSSKGHDVALSIGGDNYCYSREDAEKLTYSRETLRKRKMKTVLWGCSVEPESIDEALRRDFQRYDLIVARESITYNALIKINPRTILTPDPAFALERKPGLCPKGLGTKPYIGINVSPLIQGKENHAGITMRNYEKLIDHILISTDRDVALIPHVVWPGNDDREPLKQLYDVFRNTGRVYLVENQGCMELKGIISNCEFFVGARTHATIAAYSTFVPTLVVGYSVKARGIAIDLFGTENGYVLPVQCLNKDDDLVSAFQKMYKRRGDIRSHLSDVVPQYVQGLKAAKEAVAGLL